MADPQEQEREAERAVEGSATAESPTESPALVNLKLLSPSDEYSLSLRDLAAATTVKDLRLRIQQELASHPPTDRMRLIYRGHVLARETDSLLDVFGADNIRESKDQTLHLVLRDVGLPRASLDAARPETTPAPARLPESPRWNPAALPAGQIPQNPFRTIPDPRPHSQPPGGPVHVHQHLPHHHHPHHHHHHNHTHGSPLVTARASPAPGNPLQNPLAFPNLPAQQLRDYRTLLAQQNAQNAENGTVSAPGSRTGTPAPPDGTPRPVVTAAPAAAFPAPFLSPLLPPTSTHTYTTTSIGPNGERVTVTYNNTQVTLPVAQRPHPLLPRQFPHPQMPPVPFGLPNLPTGTRRQPSNPNLARVSAGLNTARQEMDNVRTLLATPSSSAVQDTNGAPPDPPAWRLDRIRLHMQNLNQGLEQIQQGMNALTADPTVAFSPNFIQLQQSANALRGSAENAAAMLDRIRNNAQQNQTAAPNQVPSATSQTLSTPVAHTQAQHNTSTAFAPTNRPEFFLLSGPAGPVGILFDQRGTYTTAPLVPTLPFNTFTNQFSANRQTIANLGAQIAQGTHQISNHLTPGQNATPTAPNPGAAQNDQVQPGQQNQNQNANQAPVDPQAAANERLARWAGHGWLLFKLACFVYIFSGHGGWYRPIMLGIAALITYLAQLGLFDNVQNQVRQHFEALLPLGERAGQQGQAQGQNQNQNGNGNGNGNAPITPEEAARRLIQQRQEQQMGWLRQSLRGVERAFALFVASLWPGVGERMVRAQEERERAERAAEEERQRQEEERRAQEAQAAEEAAESEKKVEGALDGKVDNTVVQPESTSQADKGKGKERAREEDREASQGVVEGPA